MKLTEAQMALLWELRRFGRYHIAGKPMTRALARRGLVETNEYGCTVITDAGRAVLEHEEATWAACDGSQSYTAASPLAA